MVQFPNVSPEIFSFSFFGINFALRWYALSYIAGFFCAIKLMKYFIKKKYLWKFGMPPFASNQADAFLTYLILGVILGGRLGYVFFYNFSYYINSPLDILRIWDGGMAFHGGFLGVIFAVLIFCRVNSIQLWSGADLIAIATPPGLFFGRLANFVNVELWGKPTDMPWGIIFPGQRAQTCEGIVGVCARHPTQLYEALLEGLVLFIILIIVAYRGGLKKPGLATGVFSIGYGFARFFVEYFRVPDPQFFSNLNPNGYAFQFASTGITMGQALSMPMIIIGMLLILISGSSESTQEK